MRTILLVVLALASACGSAEQQSVADKNDCRIIPRLIEESVDTSDRKLMTFQRWCAGDTHFTMNVSLIHGSTWSKGPGNILVIERPTATNENDYPMAFASFADSGGIDVNYEDHFAPIHTH